MITISLHADTKALIGKLGNLAAKQIPYATALAINDLASQVQVGETALIRATFKNPRPFTAKSVLRKLASKNFPVAVLTIRPEVAKYLQPYETGGLHVLPGKALLDPVDIRLDQYGQLPQQTMTRLTARKDIYIGPIQTKSAGVISGVWQRVAVSRAGNKRVKGPIKGSTVFHQVHGALKLLIRFGNAIPVKQHLGFHDRAIEIVKAGFIQAFHAAMAKAIATAKIP